jgi:hypothetical protein
MFSRIVGHDRNLTGVMGKPKRNGQASLPAAGLLRAIRTPTAESITALLLPAYRRALERVEERELRSEFEVRTAVP